MVSVTSFITGIDQLMKRVCILFGEYTGSGTPQLLHMRTDAQREADMVAERADVCPGIAPDTEQDEPAFDTQDLDAMDRPYTQVSFDSAPPRGALVDPAGEIQGNTLQLFPSDIPLQAHQADILLFVLQQ
jgi:hypothetical protein